ncbi:FT-interacting protein 1 [Senna tora]|uniref:FT-interacting protein 1 n=1 Tax=Senna tora TaxID=362788 RepID=A0A834T8K4_9FABA|nr:FT-interacting protein 1 [Senna tora]
MMANQNKKPNADFNLKEITPSIGAKSGITTATDLVEINFFLFVRIVKAKDLPGIRGPNTCEPYVEVKVGGFKMTTICFSRNSNPEWDQVFALEKARIQESSLEIVIKDRILKYDEIVGRVSFSISDIPTRVPTDSSLAPQWYGLEDQKGRKLIGELMVSCWIGTQADEAFPEAWHLDATSINIHNILSTHSQIYLSPRIWCLRINVIQAQDLLFEDRPENSDIFVQATLGSLTFRSKLVNNNKGNPKWNEDMFISVLEPFDQRLFLSVEQGTLKNHKSIGKCVIPVKNADKRLDSSPASAKWHSLERPKIIEVEQNAKVASRLSLRLSLDGGYHIFDEDPHFSSDLNATAKKLWRPSVGVFEMGILNASGLPAMKKGNRTDAYCVAKYGPKWVRTRTIVNSLSPKWNEQYSWDVYDPCTFITIAVFDNGQLQEGHGADGAIDARIGKVRISLSEMITDKLYTYSFPLTVLQPTGLKKMGELQLAFRFCCPSLSNLLKVYELPMLPRLHFANPLSVTQLSGLRKQTIMLLSSRMSKAEPALRREVVSYILDSQESVWSIRRGRVDFERINVVVSGAVALYTQYKKICKWSNPISTLIVYLVLFVVILEPQFVLPAMFFCLILNTILQYPKRPKHLSHVDLQLSHVQTANVDELEEEFDPIPSKFEDNIIRQRYDRLRIIAGRFVSEVGKIATRGEKLGSFLSWQDPTSTLLFMILCLVSGIVTLFLSFRVIVCFWLLYLTRHPIFRSAFPTVLENWVGRMPSKLDSML